MEIVDNHGMRLALAALKRVRTDLGVGSPRAREWTSLAQLSLQLRRRLEEEIRAAAKATDYDPLVLNAFQETLRIVVAPKSSGLRVGPEQVEKALASATVPDIFATFFGQYFAQLNEWQNAVQADVDADPEDVRGTVAELRGGEIPQFTAQVRKTMSSNGDVEADILAFDAVFLEYTEDNEGAEDADVATDDRT